MAKSPATKWDSLTRCARQCSREERLNKAKGHPDGCFFIWHTSHASKLSLDMYQIKNPDLWSGPFALYRRWESNPHGVATTGF